MLFSGTGDRDRFSALDVLRSGRLCRSPGAAFTPDRSIPSKDQTKRKHPARGRFLLVRATGIDSPRSTRSGPVGSDAPPERHSLPTVRSLPTIRPNGKRPVKGRFSVWYGRQGSNLQGCPPDPKSGASASSATPAGAGNGFPLLHYTTFPSACQARGRAVGRGRAAARKKTSPAASPKEPCFFCRALLQ